MVNHADQHKSRDTLSVMHTPKLVKKQAHDSGPIIKPVMCHDRHFYGYSNSKRGKRSNEAKDADTNESSTVVDSGGNSDKANFFLSPLYPDAPFVFNDVTYASVAHYMQAMKWTHDPLYQQLIMETEEPANALHIGKLTMARQRNDHEPTTRARRIVTNRLRCSDAHYRRPDWATIRERLFIKANLCKFSQHPSLKRALFDTAPYAILEDSDDMYWGCGGPRERRGLNRAGKALEKTRRILLKLENDVHNKRHS